MLVELLEKVANGENLSRQEMAQAVGLLIDEQCPEPQIAGLLIGLRVKGETVEELVGAATALKSRAVPLPLTLQPMLDTAGTGGDRSGSLNLSTAAALVAAGAGVTVAKHGNRAASSQCGSADVLEALGVNIMLSAPQVAQCIEETGVGFMFAPSHHGAMKHAAAVRKELGVRTIFNILGPLTNPAGAGLSLVGVFHPDLVGIHVRVLQRLGSRRALVVYGKDGMDEVSLGAATMVGELKDGQVTEYEIHPEDFGLHMKSNRGLKVADAQESKEMVLEALRGIDGTPREIVVLNAGTALYAAAIADSIADGIARARETIASGAAIAKLEAFAAATQTIAKQA
jgi:anthranilate phosphoribosyltransferase